MKPGYYWNMVDGEAPTVVQIAPANSDGRLVVWFFGRDQRIECADLDGNLEGPILTPSEQIEAYRAVGHLYISEISEISVNIHEP